METHLPVGNVINPVQTETAQITEQMSQKNAVFLFVKSVLDLNQEGTALTNGVVLKNCLLASSEDIVEVLRAKKAKRKAVQVLLFDALKAGNVKISCEKTDAQLRKYCSGLVNNWLKKDPRFS